MAKRHIPEYRDKVSIDQTVQDSCHGCKELVDLSKLSRESRQKLREILEAESARQDN